MPRIHWASYFFFSLVLLGLSSNMTRAEETRATWIRSIGEALPLDKSLVLHLSPGNAAATLALSKDGHNLVQGLYANASLVVKAREAIQARGLYGSVCVRSGSMRKLPYADHLAIVVVYHVQHPEGASVPEAVVHEVQAPHLIGRLGLEELLLHAGR